MEISGSTEATANAPFVAEACACSATSKIWPTSTSKTAFTDKDAEPHGVGLEHAVAAPARGSNISKPSAIPQAMSAIAPPPLVAGPPPPANWVDKDPTMESGTGEVEEPTTSP